MNEKKLCFVISPIGKEDSPTRKWADQTAKHLIEPVAESHGFEVLRADKDPRAGIITTHIIQRLASADLVIADLTGRNPNVFYELAVRHVTRKPLIQIIRAEEEIPFDVQGMRTVKFELNDPDILVAAKKSLDEQISAVLEEEKIETPISQAIGQQAALESGDPGQVELADLAAAVQDLTAEVRGRSNVTYNVVTDWGDGEQAGAKWQAKQTPIVLRDFRLNPIEGKVVEGEGGKAVGTARPKVNLKKKKS